MSQSYKCLFIYDKDDELIKFTEFDELCNLNSHYSLKNNKLTKFNCFKYKENGKFYTERNKAIIVFEEDCSLFHTFLDQESRVVAQKKNSFMRDSPKVLNKICVTNENNIESFSINKSLLKTWLEKL